MLAFVQADVVTQPLATINKSLMLLALGITMDFKLPLQRQVGHSPHQKRCHLKSVCRRLMYYIL